MAMGDSGGAYTSNIISWLIGSIMINIWIQVGALFGLLGDHQKALDAVLAIVEESKPALVGTDYNNALAYEV
jgi:hypothetical protein